MIVNSGLTTGGCLIERHEAEAFLTLAKELHFGRAAERLHVSTARVSQTIRKLERQVGVPLFRRTSRRVELTPVGRQLHDELRPAWEGMAEALRHAIETGRGTSGTLTAVFISAAGAQLLAGAALVFRDQLPDCDVQLREAQARQLLPWLRSGEANLGLSTVPVDEPGIDSGPVLVREARMLAVPLDHPFARRGSIAASDLARVNLAERDGTFEEALTLVGAGQGTLVAGAHARRYYARPDIVYVPVSDAPPLEWGLIWPADRNTARVRAFAAAADDLVHDHTGHLR
jgi:DNA-binding transcriptional LysR family regulator